MVKPGKLIIARIRSWSKTRSKLSKRTRKRTRKQTKKLSNRDASIQVKSKCQLKREIIPLLKVESQKLVNQANQANQAN